MRMPGELSPMASSFLDAKVSAANVVQPGEQGEYTPEMFWQDFPQFTKTIPSEDEGEEIKESLVPETMLLQFIGQANDSVLPSRWGSMWRYAAGLYVAHFAALYLPVQTVQRRQPAVLTKSVWSGRLPWGIPQLVMITVQ